MRKASTRWLALFLAVLLSFSLFVMPAAADDTTAETAQETAQAEEQDDEGVVQTAQDVEVPEVNVIEVPEAESADETAAEQPAEEEQAPAEEPVQPEETAAGEAPAAEDNASEEPEQDGAGEHTVTYYDGTTVLGLETVADGEAPSKAPTVFMDDTPIAGWEDSEGKNVKLADLAVTADISLYAWAMPALEKIDHTVYINGRTTTTFEPNGNLTRAEAAKLLYGLLASADQGPVTCTFTDVPSDKWYTPAVTTLASYGVLSGYSDGTFLPNASITRAEFVTIIVRITGVSGGEASFTDISTHWAAASIAAAASRGWVNGYSDGTFGPGKKITRAEAVTILNRVLGRTPDTAAIDADSDNTKFTDVSGHWAYYQIMEAALEHTYTISSGTEVWDDYAQDTFEGSGLVKVNGVTYYVKDGKKTYLTAGINKVDEGFVYASSAGYTVTADLYTTPNTVTFTDGTTASKSLVNSFNLVGKTLFYWDTTTNSAKYLTAGLNTIDGKTYYANADGYNIRNDFGSGPVELNGKLYLSDGACAIITSGQVYKYATSALTTADLAGRLYEYTVYNSSGSITSSAMYYVNSDYSLLRNAWYTHLYFGSDGKYTTTNSTLDTYVNNIILNYVGIDNNVTTQYQKLLKAYYYLRGGTGNSYSTSQYKYRRFSGEGYVTGWYNNQAMYDWQISSANKFFGYKYGMCYEWACGYLFLARRLGFDAYSVVGQVFTSRARHCWNMIYWNGSWHISDVELEWGYIAGYYTGGVSEYWDLSSQTVSSQYVTSYTNPECTSVKYYFSTGK